MARRKLKLALPIKEMLNEVVKRTPSSEGHHIHPSLPHEHPIDPDAHYTWDDSDRTGRLAAAWKVRRRAVVGVPVGSITMFNDAKSDSGIGYAPYVEFGWVSSRGFYVPGHYMLKRAMPHIRRLLVKENRKRLHVMLGTPGFISDLMKHGGSVDYSEFMGAAETYFRINK